MTVKELINELKQYPMDMKVVKVTDFENVDEYGNCEVEDIECLSTQTYPDVQFGSNDVTELMIY